MPFGSVVVNLNCEDKDQVPIYTPGKKRHMKFCFRNKAFLALEENLSANLT